jgi:2-keto-4-pentenoate hydratase/2-oxohepta-3-ene-1,7-dioic acid hydratase in catechol pathway
MKFARIYHETLDGPEPRVAVMAELDSGWIDIRAALRERVGHDGASIEAARRIAGAVVPSSLSDALAGGAAFLDAARWARAERPARAQVPADARLINALDPSGYRDYMCFEQHFSFGYRWQDKPVPDVMYELPISYCGNPLAFLGPGEDLPWPGYSVRLDYELELGIVIGRPGTNLTPEQAIAHIAGLTILNDVSARDIQAREMTGGLGPSKGKHFACVVGPYVTTLDELPWKSGLRMQARVNGETWCDTSSAEAIWSIPELVAWASQAEQLVPGQLLGTGTCNGGSTIELGRELSPGDEIEFEIEGLGVLHNRVGTPGPEPWIPEPRAHA